ncbi:MAG TPA: DNA glycosylase [Candidatus Limnocylindrales bacterium]|jgi:N-glycosylase/DNA lyase|nr:DNA glycosylase [Candidatus Limnocylindrales bacterium]
MSAGLVLKSFPIRDYDLAATLSSGQAFCWRSLDNKWVGVIGHHWVRLDSDDTSIRAETVAPVSDWNWLQQYLQLETNISSVITQFPEDEPMRTATAACRGLRLLRQDPWECLASFICSSTKQIVQIQQIVGLLCERFGEAVITPLGVPVAHSFPPAVVLAEAKETDLRACKMGFRAPYLLKTAQQIARGELDLASLNGLPVEFARERLMMMPGVGRKIADCVLLFGYGMQSAFPVDIWVMKALRELYFPRRKVKLPRLLRFSAEYFGPYGGYAQQYLFHYMRTKRQRTEVGRQGTQLRGPRARTGVRGGGT